MTATPETASPEATLLEATPLDLEAPAPRGTLSADRQSLTERVLLFLFIAIPLVAVIAAIPIAWGWGVGWVDLALLAITYVIAAGGITVGFHRHFTHGSFKASRPLRIGLAVAGSYAIEGPLIRWVADHRKHHAFSDREGDPHSPWRFGTSTWALTKGLLYAHMGWLFDVEQTSQAKYAPDLLKDRDIVRVSRLFPWFVAGSLLIPAVIGGLLTWSWWGAVTAFFWAGLVRVALVHHVTWSINSICHVWGSHPFLSRDRSGNVWWLAIPSLGESWHNLHHADPTAARHGVEPGQIDISARVIRWFERAGWATDVRWPKPERLGARRAPPA
jgi:stearoyl-CoA desaturase (delta-9 desaturase)